MQAGDTEAVVMAARVKVSRYQNTSSLESVLGCRGAIKLIYSDTSYVIDFGESKVATLHPGCIEMPSDQDDKLTVNTNCLKAAARGDQAAVEALYSATFVEDYLDFVLDLPEARVVGLFLETSRHPAKFLAALQKAQSGP